LISSIPAKAGAVKLGTLKAEPVKASATVNAKLERSVFMALLPYAAVKNGGLASFSSMLFANAISI
jgi:hypothetical protein